MLSVSLIDELARLLLGRLADHLLHALGGPDHVPHRNEDFVWF
jgi:hypothetical protein